MSEPKAKAHRIEQVIPSVFRWHLSDERIGGAESDAFAVSAEGRVILIDPLPVDEKELQHLGEVSSIVLTASCHQRSAWRYRKLFGVQVYAPENAEGLEEEPDLEYSEGEALPAGLIPFHTPGPTDAMFALWYTQPRGVLFLSDLLMHDGSGLPRFIESGYQDDPRRTRESVRRLAHKLSMEVLCFNHGPPIVGGANQAIRRALEEDHEFPEVHAP